ncbi:MAG TPA: electron transfer flavoprotein subunit alpha [Clostridia bacterium]|nr:electron transfer flavoprotein subunit alpha [Clostridia bacterium]
METILFLAHTEADGTLPKVALEALGAAQELAASIAGSPLVVGLFGGEVKLAADAIAECGAQQILAVAGAEYAQSRYSTDAAAVEMLCRASKATIVIAPATSRCARVISGVSHRINGRVDTHVNSITVTNDTPAATRWFYRQRMVADLERTQRPWLMLIDSGCHAAYEGAPGMANVENVQIVLGEVHKRTNVTGIQAPKSDEQTIRPDADLLFVAGAGWTKKQKDGQAHPKEAETHILGFLKLTQASLGSSKSLVDLSGEGQDVLQFMSHLNQVGQTGSTPRHAKGLSTCCHGEEPHVVGWRFINERRAINLDANCGWARGKADVVYVADAFEVLTKLNALLAEKKLVTA